MWWILVLKLLVQPDTGLRLGPLQRKNQTISHPSSSDHPQGPLGSTEGSCCLRTLRASVTGKCRRVSRRTLVGVAKDSREHSRSSAVAHHSKGRTVICWCSSVGRHSILGTVFRSWRRFDASDRRNRLRGFCSLTM